MRVILAIFIIASCLEVFSQQSVPHEEVYLQTNSNFILAGETLYFSAFVSKATDGTPSGLSKILYVQLIGKDNRVIFQQKIPLKNGRGSSSFFVPSLVSTGSYQLIAYTRWMKNFENYFQSKIQLVNPFEIYEFPVSDNNTMVTFHPEDGAIIQGIDNTVIIKIESSSGLPITSKGRIVDDLGEKICDISTEANGLGRFVLSAKPGRTYQAILEDESGNFQFYPLPNARIKDNYLQLTNQKQFYEFSAFSNKESPSKMIVSDGYQTIFESTINGKQTVNVPKKLFTSGAYLAAIIGGETILSQRPFIHLENRRSNPNKPTKYATRSLVEIPLDLPSGSDVSVSVSRSGYLESNFGAANYTAFSGLANAESYQGIDDWQSLDNLILINKWNWPIKPVQNDVINFLPELRGELISGTLTKKQTPIKEGLVTFSISGENYQISSAKTNENGRFTIQQPYKMEDHVGYLTTSDTGVSVNINMDNPFLSSYPEFDYSDVTLDSALIQIIVDRSLQVQIDNAYYNQSDSTFEEQNIAQFGEYRSKYVLDEFNRFPKMYEHFIEFIPEVMARDNRFNAKIKPLMIYALPDKLDPLILLDGVPVSDVEMLKFSPYKIESIGVINNRIFSGPLIADGLVSFHTFEKNLQGFKLAKSVIKTDYQGLERPTVFDTPNYDGANKKTRTPDYRQQLYWNPELIVSESKSVSFYTGDTKGRFLVKIDGFHEGKPISQEYEIIVE